MKFIIDDPQKSDYGTGLGHLELEGTATLKEVLDYIELMTNSWGTVYIYNDRNLLRCFDYELYNQHIFYHHLAGWEYKLNVEQVRFDYCFMNQNYYIYITKAKNKV